MTAQTAWAWTGSGTSTDVTGTAAVVSDDYCGDNVTWTMTDTNSDGTYETLTISGTGEMWNYTKDQTPWLFSYRDNITTVVIDNGVTHICDYAFDRCSNLTSIEIPSSMKSIGNYAFNICSKLTTVAVKRLFPLTTLGTKAFDGCSALTTIYVPTASVDDYKAAANWSDKSSIIMGYDGMGNCGTTGHESEVTWVLAQYGVLMISGMGAMADYSAGNAPWYSDRASITSIVIDEGVTHIGNYAFYGCNNENLTSATIYAPSLTMYSSTAFAGTNAKLKIHVFNGCVDTYKSGWSDYASRIEAITIPAEEAETGEYWATYFNNLSNAQAPSGTQVFKVTLSGTSLKLVEIPDRIINKGKGVVLKSASSSIQPEYAASGSTHSYNSNRLEGKMTRITNPGNAYMLKNGSDGIGFYRLSDTDDIVAQTAYLTYSGTEEFLPLACTVTMNSAGIMTYASKTALDFTGIAGLTAYIVSDFSGSTLTLSSVGAVPAGTGLLLKGTPSTTFTVPVATSASAPAQNYLVGVTDATTEVPVTTSTNTNFILANGNYGIDWYTLSEAGAIGANKAYLSLPTNQLNLSNNAAGFQWIYEGETTNLRPTPSPSLYGGEWYDLSGRKLSQKPTKKGIYINNGRKVVIK